MSKLLVFILGVAVGTAIGLGIAVYLALNVLQADMIYPSVTLWA